MIEPIGNASGFAALFTTMSIPPKCSAVAAASAATCSTSPTWVGTAYAEPPAAVISSTVDSHASAFRLATTTCAPSDANPSEIARPMPLLPPVTIATRPAMSNELITGSTPDKVDGRFWL